MGEAVDSAVFYPLAFLGVWSTDLVLRVTEVLRQTKVVGKFVEFFGPGARALSVDWTCDLAIVRRTLDDALATYRRTPAAALELLDVGDSPADTKLPAPELAAWTLVASQVLNLDESLTK